MKMTDLGDENRRIIMKIKETKPKPTSPTVQTHTPTHNNQPDSEYYYKQYTDDKYQAFVIKNKGK